MVGLMDVLTAVQWVLQLVGHWDSKWVENRVESLVDRTGKLWVQISVAWKEMEKAAGKD